MPLPTPSKGESRNKFVSRCVSALTSRGEGKSQEQRVAICIAQFKKSLINEIKEGFENANTN